jgi:predicted transcriptional regulator
MPTDAAHWTLLTNHGHVLVCIAREPDILLSDIAARVGIRERAAHRIVNDLVEAGYVTRTRVGRRNHYEVHGDQPLRHRLQRDLDAATLLRLVGGQRRRQPAGAA